MTREIDSIAVYGREQGFAVHELVGLAGEADAERQAAHWIAHYEQGLARYRARDFAGAVTDFEGVSGNGRTLRPAELMQESCQQLLRTAPDQAWRPVAVLNSK